ncbi:LysR family transcriptional regulator, partial [Lactiplantibacillus plantarum]
MNTKDLAYFDELISQKNFSKVAKTFGVSQPTVTTAIKRLESEF